MKAMIKEAEIEEGEENEFGSTSPPMPLISQKNERASLLKSGSHQNNLFNLNH